MKETENEVLDLATYVRIDELRRVASTAVAKAQDENRRLGVPNVYSINGRIYYELPSGELSLNDPYENGSNASCCRNRSPTNRRT